MNPIYFFLGVIITIVIGNSFIIFAESDSKVIYSNWILIINSLIAVGLSAMILIKDKVREEGGEVDKANILLALGLVFWFIANIIWAYYELVLDIVSPVPSLADLFLLSAYGFLIYRLTIVYRKIGGNYDFWIVSKDNDSQSYEWKKEHNVLTDTKEEEKPDSFK